MTGNFVEMVQSPIRIDVVCGFLLVIISNLSKWLLPFGSQIGSRVSEGPNRLNNKTELSSVGATWPRVDFFYPGSTKSVGGIR